MSTYNFQRLEQKWQQWWHENQSFRADNATVKPPYYILDMFPYPSGAGLHVGHPLGYITSDILARYRRHKGFEVLHPMGFDAFGLPAEQFAIDTGNHPSAFTDQNIERYRTQLKMLGLSYDWTREVKTSDPSYYKWTQQIFLHLFHSWYNPANNKAESIADLIATWEAQGCKAEDIPNESHAPFTVEQWKAFTAKEQSDILNHYRLAYSGETEVNWCQELGTVLANEEVINGLSERGGYPVVRKKMRQWMLRISKYADRLLQDLETIDWPESIKETQRYWIGKSVGARVRFPIAEGNDIEVFTTRPDTLFGVSFLVLAPEHELVASITTAECKEAVIEYQHAASMRSDRDRMADTKTISGVFTGAYATHPFSKEPIPIWIADYVLADYGTGAIMAVPAHDERDWAFAKHFSLPIPEVVQGGNPLEACYSGKTGTLVNSDFLNGLEVPDAIKRAIGEIEKQGLGASTTQFKLRDAIFGRQRYWGEPIPIIWDADGVPRPLSPDELPLQLPEVESYKPSGSGESPLASVLEWVNTPRGRRETDTMPGWAGSSWYFLRYMDPHNSREIVSADANQYWGNVDFYLGGAEHATGHLIYARFWNKFLYDIGLAAKPEPFQKMVNQGMIQGRSSFAWYHKETNAFHSANNESIDEMVNELQKVRIDISYVHDDKLDIAAFKAWKPAYQNVQFIADKDGSFYCIAEVEKMSKSKYNVVTPDEVIANVGCDAFRMYEMFLGPIEQSKPWDTKGIEGVSRLLKRVWAMFYDQQGKQKWNEEAPTAEELKILHKCIKRVDDDLNRLSMNTCVSHFMIAVNELTAIKCSKRAILEPFVILISPFAPHIAEELWELLGNAPGISKVAYPVAKEEYLIEDEFDYPVQFNGKVRFRINLALDLDQAAVEQALKADENWQRFAGEAEPKKIILVKGRIINVVL